jgi:hypothetical protein
VQTVKNGLPENLIFKGASLKLLFETKADVNRTLSSIIIEGTASGFLSLANAILYYLNDLQEVIPLHELSFVSSEIKLTINIDDSLANDQYGRLRGKNAKEFEWRISESSLCQLASEIHSLGHINEELHLDQGKQTDEISVYCVLQNNGG